MLSGIIRSLAIERFDFQPSIDNIDIIIEMMIKKKNV